MQQQKKANKFSSQTKTTNKQINQPNLQTKQQNVTNKNMHKCSPC